MSRADALKKLIQIERLKQDSVELQAKKQDVVDLTNVSNSQLTTISNLRGQVLTYEAKEVNYKGQISILEKEVKKWKRKNKLTAISGLVLTGIITGLFIFK